jgi:diguanylate cyclase (GGDEF)-like protein
VQNRTSGAAGGPRRLHAGGRPVPAARDRVGQFARAAVPVAVAVVAAEVVWLAAGLPAAAVVSDAGAIIVAVLAAACCAEVARRHPRALRRFWLLMAATMGLAAAGRLVWTAGRLSHPGGDLPNNPLVGAIFTAGIICGTAALLSGRSAPFSAAARTRAVLDGVIVGLALLPVGWVLVFEDVVAAQFDDPIRALGVLYPVLDLMQLTILVVVSASSKLWRPLTVIGLGLAIRAVADTLYISLVAQDSYMPGHLLDSCWPLSYLLVALATRYPPPIEADQADDAREPTAVAWWRLALPYLPVGGTIVAMLFIRRAGAIPPLLFLTEMALLATLAVRQGLAANEINRLARQLRRLAYRDQLTGLPNRLLFTRKLRQAILLQRPVAVLLLDLDGFKEVNDRFGHAAGDRMLTVLAGRMREAVGDQGLLARIGGDEFAVLVTLHPDRSPDQLAQRMLAAVRDCEQQEAVNGVQPSASIGVAEYAAHHAGHADLLRDADIAMYAAKAAGKSAYRVCTPALREAAVTRAELIADLRRAVDVGTELEVEFQPIVDVCSHAVRGAEALVRWRHPERGLLLPERFLPLAEQSGLVAAIDAAVMQRACQAAVSWRSLAPEATVSVNIAPAHLLRADVVATVADATASAGLPPEALTLELTETAFIDDTDIVLERLRQLRELGVRIAIDDFGTGYSALSYLHRIPATELKIDRSFIARLEEQDGRAHATIDMIIRLATAYGLMVVAEGVETPAQHRAVAAIGCPRGQGFLYGPPGSLARLHAVLAPA